MSIIKSAYAATINLQPAGTNFEAVSQFRIENIIPVLFSLLLVVTGIIFLFILIMGGIKWMMSEGDDKKLASARNQVTNALVGLAIVFAAWAVVALINTIFQINLLSFDLPVMKLAQ